MNRLPIAIAVGMALIAAGCRSSGNQELVEREFRWQEDRIRHLESHISECEQLLDACRAGECEPEAQTCVRQHARRPQHRANDRRAPDEPSPSDFTPPSVQLPGVEQAPPFKGPPQISPPNPSVPDGVLPPEKSPMTRSADPGPSVELPEVELPPPTGPSLEPR